MPTQTRAGKNPKEKTLTIKIQKTAHSADHTASVRGEYQTVTISGPAESIDRFNRGLKDAIIKLLADHRAQAPPFR
jgi:hypothetical protein